MLEPSFYKYVSILQKKAYSCSTYLKLMSAASVTEFIILGYVSKVVHHTELFEIEPVVVNSKKIQPLHSFGDK